MTLLASMATNVEKSAGGHPAAPLGPLRHADAWARRHEAPHASGAGECVDDGGLVGDVGSGILETLVVPPRV